MQSWLDCALQDLRYALRTLRKSPGFTLIAVLTLALGIGATTAIFSAVDCILIKTFPYKNADRLAAFYLHFPHEAGANDRYNFYPQEFLAFKQQNHVFVNLIGLAGENLLYTGNQGPRRIAGGFVTSDTFETLGVQPLLGRPVAIRDGDPDSPPVFVMSYAFWSREFNRDAGILGKTFLLNDQPRTLVAIMPPRFTFGEFCEIWIPVTVEKQSYTTAALSQGPWFEAFGVLKSGTTTQSAASDLDLIATPLSKIYPGAYLTNFKVGVKTLKGSWTETVRPLLLTLGAAAVMLLLIGCANVANLLLSRATTRDKEIAIRASMGASRVRLIRQLFLETALLALVGAALGSWLAYFALQMIAAIVPAGTLPGEVVIHLNAPAMCFAIGVAALSTFLCGFAPLIYLTRGSLYARAAGHDKGVITSAKGTFLRSGFVVSEIALSIVLLVGTGLMVRTMLALQHVSLGFNPAGVLTARFSHSQRYETAEQKNLFIRNVLERLEALPGVQSATESIRVPTDAVGLTSVLVHGSPGTPSLNAVTELCSEHYFQTLRTPLLSGRFFSRAEVDSASHLVIVNHALASRFFPNGNPLGRKVDLPNWELNYSDWPRGASFEIIGVVADAKNKDLREPSLPQVYLPYTMTATGLNDDRGIMVKTSRNSAGMLPIVRQAIQEVDPTVAVTDMATLQDFLETDFYAQPRFGIATSGTFATIGLMLVAVGIFSTMAYHVAMRTREIGIRMALGAHPHAIRGMILSKGTTLIGAGIVLGLAASYGLTRFLTSQIWGIAPNDPWTLASVVGVVTASGLAACYLPARRATKVDPLVALRYE